MFIDEMILIGDIFGNWHDMPRIQSFAVRSGDMQRLNLIF